MRYKNEYRKATDEDRPTMPTETKMTPYWILATLRILLTILPQTGYIHPDEYFQSIEVIAGDYFDIDVYKPWEFNVTFPIRSVAFPYLIIGIPYSVINILSPYSFYLFGITLKSPYFLVVFPRLLMCSLSFISDYCLYKVCLIYNQNYRVRLIIYASSYVMLTYATHTFSNSIELILMSLLLYFASRCMAYSNKVVFQNDYLSERYNKAVNIVERVKYYKLQASLPSHSLNHCFVLATITVAGIFNRPTFIAFALPPIFFWLQRGLGSKSVGLGDFHIRMFIFVICGIPTIILLVLTDSFYFGYLTLSEIHNLKVDINNFVVTPLNFFKYNSEIKNLETHGLHPRYLHFLINVPLLYNVLGIIGLLTFCKMILSCLKGRWLELPHSQSIISLMTASFIVPIAILSIFPHQEARFIIPVTLPLVFLHSQQIRQISSMDTVVHVNNDVTIHAFQRNKNKLSRLQTVWYICNIALTFLYGFAHQGGVLPLTSHFAAELKAKPHLTHIHLFTSHTYSIPTALLQLRNTRKAYVTSDRYKYQMIKDFYLYEQGSQTAEEIYESIASKIRECDEKYKLKSIPYRLYYALPVNFMNEFIDYSFRNNSQLLNYHIVTTFYPNVSVERLPFINITIECIVSNKIHICMRKVIENTMGNLFKFMRQFGLILLKIESQTRTTKQTLFS